MLNFHFIVYASCQCDYISLCDITLMDAKLFITQALAQDQLRTLLTMTREFNDSLNIGIYDGDTSQEDRLWLRDNARLVLQ